MRRFTSFAQGRFLAFSCSSPYPVAASAAAVTAAAMRLCYVAPKREESQQELLAFPKHFTPEQQVRHTRNFGIIAHIDSGKTTTTERMLFYAGMQRRIGEVDRGTTTTDYMPEEQERGITITSAAVSFMWNGHRVNLIDTPGHVDFSVEVNRALRVVDGVVVVFDAKVGVQAQSYTVLQMARRNRAPQIAFMNKMDKSDANFELAVQSLRDKLGVVPLLMQLPLRRTTGECIGVIDLVNQAVVTFDGKQGEIVTRGPVQEEYLLEQLRKGRRDLVTFLAENEPGMMERFLALLDEHGGDERAAEMAVCPADIYAATKAMMFNGALHGAVPDAASPAARSGAKRFMVGAALSVEEELAQMEEQERLLKLQEQHKRIMPVFLGASRRNIGVQTLMDAVVHLLPSPLERPHVVGLAVDRSSVRAPDATHPKTFVFAFKVVHFPDPKRGNDPAPFVFFRVFSGKVTQRTRLFNRRTRAAVTLDRLFLLQADRLCPVSSFGTGAVGGAFLADVLTGDTLAEDNLSMEDWMCMKHGSSSSSSTAPSAAASQASSMGGAASAFNMSPTSTEQPSSISKEYLDKQEKYRKEYLADDSDGSAARGKSGAGATAAAAAATAGAPAFASFEPLTVQPSVLSHAIEASSRHQIDALKGALRRIEVEDPSLRVSENQFGQIVVSGMGELHLDIVLSRLRREYSVGCDLTKAFVSYRESIINEVAVTDVAATADGLTLFSADVTLVPAVIEDADGSCAGAAGMDGSCVEPDSCRLVFAQEAVDGFVSSANASAAEAFAAQSGGGGGAGAGDGGGSGGGDEASVSVSGGMQAVRVAEKRARDQLAAIRRACTEALVAALKMGPLARIEMDGFIIRIDRLHRHAQAWDPQQLTTAVAVLLGQLLRRIDHRTNSLLLEPIMRLHVHLTDNTYAPAIMADLTAKQALSLSVHAPDERSADIDALVPLRFITRYSREARSIAKGNCYFHYELALLRRIVDKSLEAKILKTLSN